MKMLARVSLVRDFACVFTHLDMKEATDASPEKPLVYPDFYHPDVWLSNPKLLHPLAMVNTIKQKIPVFTYSKPAFFKFRYKVKIVCSEGILEHQYDAAELEYFSLKRVAQQAAAYMFICDPPEWLTIILNGGKPDFKKYEKKEALYPGDLFGANGNTNESTSTTGKKKDALIEELSAEATMYAIVGERQETTRVIDNEFAHVSDFTYLKLKDDFKAHPKDFVDVLGDGGVVYKTLKQGTRYADTAATVSITICAKRTDDEVIHQAKQQDFQPGEGFLPFMYWVICNMKVGEEVLGFSTGQYAYGALGLVPIVPANETITFYIKVNSAYPYNMPHYEIEDIRDTPYHQRISDAQECKKVGNRFYERKVFKMALDRYITGIRRLKLDQKDIYKLPEDMQMELRSLNALLHLNVCAVYSHKDFFPLPSEHAVELTDFELEVQYKIKTFAGICLRTEPQNIKALLRLAHALVYLQEYEKAAEKIESARVLVSENPAEAAKYDKAIRLEAAFCTKRENLYKKKKNDMDKKMGAFLLQPGNQKKNNPARQEAKAKVKEEISRAVAIDAEPIVYHKPEVKEEKAVIELDDEGEPLHEEDKPVKEPEFVMRDITPVLTGELIDTMDSKPQEEFFERPTAIAKHEAKEQQRREKARNGHGDDSVDDTETSDDMSEDSVMFFGDSPLQFFQQFVQFQPKAEADDADQGDRKGENNAVNTNEVNLETLK